MTSTLFLRETIRPTKLAFLLAGADRDLLMEAVGICSGLWGGVHNPIVILDQANRTRLGQLEQFAESCEQEILGILRDFDVDLVVTLGTDELPAFLQPMFGHRHLTRDGLSQEQWRPPQAKEPKRRFGVFLEVWPFVEKLWHEQLRGLAGENDLRVIGTVELPEDEPFVAAQFGKYRSGGPSRYLQERLGAEEATYNAQFRAGFEFRKWRFPIDLTQLALDVYGQAAFISPALFLFNPADLFDVVDYWNLRAAGMTVFPVPVPRYGEYAVGVKAFVADTKRELPEVWEGAEGQVVKARSVSDELLAEVTAWATEAAGARIMQHGWYPRFGTRQTFVSKDIDPVRVEASSSNLVVVMDGSFGHLLGTTPPCDFLGHARSQQWSSELLFYGDSDEEYMYHLPWLIRACDEVANRYLGPHFGARASRVSQTGLVNHRTGDDRDTHIQRIPVRDVVDAVLRNAGFKFLSRSSNGLAAERIIAQLGGIHVCGLFRHQGVRDVLHYLERGERSLPGREIVGKLKKLNRPGPYGTQDMERVMDALVAKKVLRPGLVFQCSSCGRHEWYHVSMFDERFQCKWCFTDQSCPRMETLQWRYRTDGLFALEGKMGGSLSVLLTILHLKEQLHGGLHYYPSFEYNDGEQTHEVDFMCFVKEPSNDIEVVVGEAKTTQDLKDDEVARMETLATRLNAWLVFCSLAVGFSDRDKEHFRTLRAAGRRLILLDAPQLELFSDEMLHMRSQPGYTEYGSPLMTLSVTTTDRAIGPLERR